jgi:hypothetical protein
VSDPEAPVPDPTPNREPGHFSLAGFLLGFFVAVAATWTLVALLAGVLDRLEWRGVEISDSLRMLPVAVLAVGLGVWGFRVHRRRRPRGLASGFVIGCCVGSMLTGSCFGLFGLLSLGSR